MTTSRQSTASVALSRTSRRSARSMPNGCVGPRFEVGRVRPDAAAAPPRRGAAAAGAHGATPRRCGHGGRGRGGASATSHMVNPVPSSSTASRRSSSSASGDHGSRAYRRLAYTSSPPSTRGSAGGKFPIASTAWSTSSTLPSASVSFTDALSSATETTSPATRISGSGTHVAPRRVASRGTRRMSGAGRRSHR